MTIWELVSTLTKTKPLVSVSLNTTTTVHIERYFVNSPHIIAPPLPATGMMVHLSGAKITAGSNKNTMREFIPSQSMVLPYNLPSEWYSCGAVDIAILYFLDTEEKQAKRLQNLVSQQPQMHGLNNPLVHSLAMRIVEKLQRGSNADIGYVEVLKNILIEEACRDFESEILTPNFSNTQQLGRVNTAIEWMKNNLEKDITIEEIAQLLQISETHFRKIFNDEMGVSPNRYLMHLRLERVRKLLTSTSLPISLIAEQSNFKTQSHLTSCFKKAYGTTPAKVRDIAMMETLN